ncbi:hypothetical protein [Stenotrophomonas maltophilia]|uniref:hypothetical protein n=1 Tax=Stenotrophomonas maltophilia TaxID=40324 RepID=UPI0007F019BC|nr:hypothetical protein [Stenotrophomonas maltophilia]OBU52259.1 hypothetical protein A9K69_16375 [Stenotrophomonas maltophilia]
MGPSTESLALADFLISKLGLQVDRISLAYAIMDHVEVEYADELAQPSPGGQDGLNYERMFVDACAALAEVSRELGCDPEQGGAEPILAAIAELREALAARQPVGQEPYGFISPDDMRKVKRDRQEGIACAVPIYLRITGEDMPKGCEPLYAAPPAQAVDLGEVRREGHDCAIRYVLGYLNGTGDLASTQYEEILNGCGRASIIRSAIRDGELEFTGLGRWVAKYGTDAERALIDSQAVGNG